MSEYQYIVSHRKSHNLSQQELSELSGISLRTIQRIENGQSQPRPFTIRKLEEVLEIHNKQSIEVDEDHMKNDLRVFVMLQWFSMILPVLYCLISYTFWKRRRWNDTYLSGLNKLMSLSLICSILVPITSILTVFLLTSFGAPVALKSMPTLLMIYFLYSLIYGIIMSFMAAKVTKGQSEALDVIPVIFSNSKDDV